MKKYILITILTISFFSCNLDERDKKNNNIIENNNLNNSEQEPVTYIYKNPKDSIKLIAINAEKKGLDLYGIYEKCDVDLDESFNNNCSTYCENYEDAIKNITLNINEISDFDIKDNELYIITKNILNNDGLEKRKFIYIAKNNVLSLFKINNSISKDLTCKPSYETIKFYKNALYLDHIKIENNIITSDSNLFADIIKNNFYDISYFPVDDSSIRELIINKKENGLSYAHAFTRNEPDKYRFAFDKNIVYSNFVYSNPIYIETNNPNIKTSKNVITKFFRNEKTRTTTLEEIIPKKDQNKIKDISIMKSNSKGEIIVVDNESNFIWKISPYEKVELLIGNGKKGYKDSDNSTEAEFSNITILNIDNFDNLYAFDKDNKAIRKITPNGKVTSLYTQNTDEIKVNF